MPSVSIKREDQGARERYLARVAGIDGEAELIFTRVSATLVRADHTEAPDTMRGTGVAKALVERLFSDARAEGFKVDPACSYVQVQAQRRADWSDLIAP